MSVLISICSRLSSRFQREQTCSGKHLLRLLLAALLLCGTIPDLAAQELQATVTVMADKVRGTDPKVFKTLQNAIRDFLNTRKWTNRSYAPNEKIVCNFLLNIQKAAGDNVYAASLTVQSIRPVYNASYQTNLLNYEDPNVTFRYVEFQPLNFNDNQPGGSDPLQANLTAVLAYYAYMIVGFDEDSFVPRGGDAFFKKAQQIVSNAPEGRDINGWKAFEGNRNRYWLVDNLLNSRLNRFHEVFYQYHRKGLDVMYDHMSEGREAVLKTLSVLNAIRADNPNVMLMPLFFTAKSAELAGIFSKAPPQERLEAANLLKQLDPSNSGRYENMTAGK
ncbi:DUF4835 family protein [Compostibacter hankyongensis]